MKKNILEYLEKYAQQRPEQAAFADEKFQYTYAALEEEAKRIGSSIVDCITPNSAVLVYMKKNVQSLCAFLGIVYGGCFYVPIDAKMPVERINRIIEVIEPALIIYDDMTSENIHELPTKCLKIHFEEMVRSQIDLIKLSKIRGKMIDTDPLYVLFTSGSTGVPKGVVVCHRSIIDYGEWLRETFDLNENTVFGNQTPFYFSMSVLDIYATLCSGATLWIIPQMLFSFPVRLLEFLNEKEINTIYWVPSALNIVANLGALDCLVPLHLKKILFAGEVMPTKQLNIWRKHLPNALYANLFGPTEITDIGVYYILDREFTDDEPIPIGIPCSNVDVLVINEAGNAVKDIGEKGELYIRGSFLAHGYYNNSIKTAEAFVQNPLNASYPEIVYKTGDIVYYNEHGELVYASRKDFQIKHMGNRIELGEIETALNSLKEVGMCCCLYKACTDQIVAVYTGEIEESELVRRLTKKIPRYMIPNLYYKLELMPLNANGKIDRGLLSQKYL